MNAKTHDQHLPVKVLFREKKQEDNVLREGYMTMKELYNHEPYVWVEDPIGTEFYVSRRDFHVVDDHMSEKNLAIVCDIDGVLNYIPKRVHGTTHRDRIELENGEACQWTELNLSATAKHHETNFRLLAYFYDQGKDILFLTARGDTQRAHTDKWLRAGFAKIGRYDIHYVLFMRGWSANDLDAPSMKAQMMQSCILPNYDVVYFIEDCPKNCAAMREACPDVPIMQIYG